LEKSKEYFITHEIMRSSNFSVHKVLLEHFPIHLVFGCLCMAELSSCNRNHMASKEKASAGKAFVGLLVLLSVVLKFSTGTV
jgi:hypothetical protein